MSDSKPIKILASEQTLGTAANTVSDSKCVRILNGSAAVTLITLADATGTVGTITMGIGQELFIKKNPTDTLKSGAASLVMAVPVAF